MTTEDSPARASGRISIAFGLVAALTQALMAGGGPPCDCSGTAAISPEPQAGGGFGSSVAFTGFASLVGAPNENGGAGAGSGLAHSYFVFADVSPGHQQVLSASDGAPGDAFGSAIAVDGALAAVAAPGRAGGLGAVDVFELDVITWIEVATISAADVVAPTGFGLAVSISGDRIIVGAPGDDDQATDAGAAYVFGRDEGGTGNWGQVVKLFADDAAASAGFGTAVTVDGDTVVVGSSSSAYVIGADSGGPGAWGPVTTLGPSDPGATAFGRAVDLDGDLAVVGSLGGAGGTEGLAFVFRRDSGGPDAWSEVAALDGSGDADRDFGRSVAVHGDRVLIGAPGGLGGCATCPGSAVLFDRNEGGADQWGRLMTFAPLDAAPDERVGWSVALSDEFAWIGARDRTVGAIAGAGGANLLTLSTCIDQLFDCNANGLPDPCELADGTATDCDGNGRLDECDIMESGVDCNGDGVLDACEPDCNANDVPDECDITAGLETDFNNNAVPDACEGYDVLCEQTLLASPPVGGGHFGVSVDIDGDLAVVGANGEPWAGGFTGAAYVYVRDGDGAWTEAARLVAPDAEAFDSFGIAVGISGDTIAIGASGDDDLALNAGAVYIFDRVDGRGPDSWSFTRKVTATMFLTTGFGNKLVIDGETLMVSQQSFGGGRVYVHERDEGGAGNWGRTDTFIGSDTASGDSFGHSMAIVGTTAVIGAPSVGFSDGGAVYVFERTVSWHEVDKLTVFTGQSGISLGRSVDIDGEFIVAGGRCTNCMFQPGAYVFERVPGSPPSWVEVAELFSPNPVPSGVNQIFGDAVAISGSLIAVADRWHGQAGYLAGAVFLFERSGSSWTPIAQINHVGASDEDWFGNSLVMKEGTLLVGAWRTDDACPRDVDCESGSAHLFGLVDCLPCAADADGDGDVDIDDIVTVVLAFGTSGPQGDVDLNGIVNVDDIVAVVLAFGPCG